MTAEKEKGYLDPVDLHPFIIHFPIVLLLVSAACDAVGTRTRQNSYLKVGYLLLVLTAVSALAAALTGENAAETTQQIASIQNDLEQHENLGTAATWLAVILTLARTHLVFKKRFDGAPRRLYLIAVLLAVIVMSASGYTGGHLVYKYGAGTEPVHKTLTDTP